jgi:hypothetical protein
MFLEDRATWGAEGGRWPSGRNYAEGCSALRQESVWSSVSSSIHPCGEGTALQAFPEQHPLSKTTPKDRHAQVGNHYFTIYRVNGPRKGKATAPTSTVYPAPPKQSSHSKFTPLKHSFPDWFTPFRLILPRNLIDSLHLDSSSPGIWLVHSI